MPNPFSGGAQSVAQDGVKLPVTGVITPGATIGLTDRGFFFPLSSANQPVKAILPNPANCIGQPLLYKKVDSSLNAITLSPFGSETIDGAPNYVLNKQFQTVCLVSDGTNWNVFTNYLNPAIGPAGTGTAGFIPLWTGTGQTLGNSTLFQDANGNIIDPLNLTVLGTIFANAVIIGSTNVGTSIQAMQAQLFDLQRQIRLLLKAMAANGITLSAVFAQAPYLAQVQLPVALGTN